MFYGWWMSVSAVEVLYGRSLTQSTVPSSHVSILINMRIHSFPLYQAYIWSRFVRNICENRVNGWVLSVIFIMLLSASSTPWHSLSHCWSLYRSFLFLIYNYRYIAHCRRPVMRIYVMKYDPSQSLVATFSHQWKDISWFHGTLCPYFTATSLNWRAWLSVSLLDQLFSLIRFLLSGLFFLDIDLFITLLPAASSVTLRSWAITWKIFFSGFVSGASTMVIGARQSKHPGLVVFAYLLNVSWWVNTTTRWFEK